MIRVWVGNCKSGKTYGMMMVVAETLAQTEDDPNRAGWRFLIIDLNDEWPGEPADVVSVQRGRPLRFVHASTPMDAHRHFQAGELAVVLRPSTPLVTDKQRRELANACAYVCTELGKAAPSGTGFMLVLPEVHHYAREGHKLPDYLGVIVHRYRHTKSGLLCDTQHFFDVRKEVLRESYSIELHGQGHPTDLARVRDYGGPELVARVQEAARRMAPKDKGGDEEPGWHVHYITNLNGPPPYELER